MRVFPISDLHLERRRLDTIPPPALDFDVLVCAGDVFEGEPERGLEALVSLAAGRPIVLVPGNHERYRGADDSRDQASLLAALAEEAARLNELGAGISLLQGGAHVVIAGVRFVGATLWSDWSLAGRWLAPDTPGRPEDPVAYAAARMTDPATGSREYLGAILASGETSWTPQDAMAAHAADRALLAAALAVSFAGPTVAVTHHPPLTEAVDVYRDAPGVPWWVPAFYTTEVLRDLPAPSRPALWISGHFHAAHDLTVAGTRSVSNPVQGAGFDAGRIVAVSNDPV